MAWEDPPDDPGGDVRMAWTNCLPAGVLEEKPEPPGRGERGV
jgi:hypothetical protein